MLHKRIKINLDLKLDMPTPSKANVDTVLSSVFLNSARFTHYHDLRHTLKRKEKLLPTLFATVVTSVPNTRLFFEKSVKLPLKL